MNTAELPLVHQATIPDAYTDVMGHMNVMWYTHLFDMAVARTFDVIGLGHQYLVENGHGAFALEAHVRYLAEVLAGQSVSLRLHMVGRSAKRFHLMIFMDNDTKQEIASTFEVVGAYIDMSVRRMAPLPSHATARIDALIEEHRSLGWPAPVCGVMKA